MHPLFDYMLIGGGLSIVVFVIVLSNPHGAFFIGMEQLPYFILLSNSAHFAASTVRLYTKPGAYRSLPFLTMALPLVALGLLTLCMFQAENLGTQLTTLYLTWSPFHYAAQAYGLAVMYCHRSGCTLSKGSKKLVWWVSMLPFFYEFVVGKSLGLHWLDFAGLLDNSMADKFVNWYAILMPFVAFAGILFLVWRIWKREPRPMPLISILTLVTNAVWWFFFPPLQAFVWATVFHGIQYLAIVIIFHVKDQRNRADRRRRGVVFHVLWFYGVCVFFGYALFNCVPRAYVFVGFGPVESVLLVVAVINLHHFVVDAYIWRLKKSDNNRRIVDAGTTTPI